MTTAPPAKRRRSPDDRRDDSHQGFPVVGIVGAGQLARMCQPPAVALSVTLRVLAASEEESAAQVVPDALVGPPDDIDSLRRLAERSDVITFDHEHVPADALAALERDGVVLHPSPSALRHAQDKVAMRSRLTELGLPCPRWKVALDAAEVTAFGDDVGWPVIAKTPRGGYDGKGVRRIEGPGDIDDWLEAVGQPGALAEGVLLEEAVAFSRELAALVARSPSGDTASWPLVETVQEDGICTEVIAPAPGVADEDAQLAGEIAARIADALDVTGVLAVELFEVVDDRGRTTFVVNELAMRPHNSGHWTIDGAVTSQFEQHLRAVLDLPLGAPTPRATWTVMANVLGGSRTNLHGGLDELLTQDAGLRVHLYGKQVRQGRKIGHVTVCGDDLDDLRRRARHAADHLRGASDR